MTNATDHMEKIGNNYGAAFTPEEFVEFGKAHWNLKPTTNNLVMRQQLSGYGFSRVSRKFAAAVMVIMNK
jgi:hypothetical protein|tara:strand:+ start:92 stop:301 length:210 start_codon:yes stop_codon:yes gene_type:complete